MSNDYNILSPMKGKRKTFKFGVLDIEAHDWIEFIVGGIYDARGFETFGYDDGGFIEMLNYLWAEDNETDVYFCHFGGKYDMLFVFDTLIKSEGRFDFEKIIKQGSRILTMSVTMRGTDRKIKFWDSSALLPFKLETLTNSFKVEALKGSTDYRFIKQIYHDIDYSKELIAANKEDEKNNLVILHTRIYKRWELLQYLKNDCVGLFQVLDKFYSWAPIHKAGQGSTLAGQAMRIYRTYIKDIIYGLEDWIDEFIRPAYQGGRVEIFKPVHYNSKQTISCYDVNSLYPHVMRHYEYPLSFRCETTTYRPDEMGFYEVTINVPEMHVPPLGVNHDGKFIFPTGILKGRWTVHELNCAIKVGCKILEVHRGLIFNSGGKIFEKFIDDFYEIRKNSAGDSVDNLLAKLIMNSSYGKWGISNDKEDIGWEDGTDGETPFATVRVEGKDYRLCTRPVELRGFSNVAVAAYVTSYARVWMYEHYWQPLGKKLFYCDTDSLYTTEKMKSSNELGEVKLEGPTEGEEYACFILPKTYITPFKLKMKGVSETAVFTDEYIKNKKKYKNMALPKECIKFNFLDFYHALQGEKERLKASVRGTGIYSFSEALRRKKKVLCKKDDMIKLIKCEYDKRTVIKKGKPENWTTKALHIDMVKKT
jgi:hypothetical protein